jgi:hypothetical protein
MAQVLKRAESAFADDVKMEAAMRPLPDADLESDDLPTLNWYEQDLDRGTPRRLISSLATAEDRKHEKAMFEMIEASQDPNYDDAMLNRGLIDSLLTNPNFADLAHELRDIKAGIKTREELAVLDAQAEADAQRESKEYSAGLRMATHQALQELIDDPAARDAREELQEVLDKMPEMEDLDSPAFQRILETAMAKLNISEAFQQKMAAMPVDASDADLEKEWADFEREVDDVINESESDDADLAITEPEDQHDIDLLLTQMRDVVKSIGGDSALEAELDAVLNEDPTAKQEGDFEREMDAEELVEELKKLAQSKASLAKAAEAEAEEDVPAELQAKVDKIMEDPQLMEKLVYIQKLIDEAGAKSGITAIAHETAPDPYKLDRSRTATLDQRMQVARKDPAHTEAMHRLRVRLLPPFNISPALKSYNQAIELAYIGANDDIRRILWRAYQKARTLPTFLQNMSDEAWDILYYSQAVKWNTNQNREAHLRMLLADLQSVGRDGPPTHPSSLTKEAQGEHLEA